MKREEQINSVFWHLCILGEKLKILHALCGKLLTMVSTRDFIEDNADDQRAAKQELRELKAEQHRRVREEAAERYGITKI